jgi:iron(III) transport system permease protein
VRVFLYKNTYLVAFTLALFVTLVSPGIMLFIGTAFFPELGQVTFTFLQFVETSANQILLLNTLEFAIGQAVVSVGIALFYAWIVARTDVPMKRFFQLLPILGLTLPALVQAFVWSFLFSPRFGPANVLVRYFLGTRAPVFNVFSMPGLIIVAGLAEIPLPYLLIYPSLRSIDSTLEEASRIAGKSFLETFAGVTFPLVLPSVLSAFLLTVIGGFGNFDFPIVLGQPAGIHVIATEIYYWVSERFPPAYGNAGIISLYYVIFGLVLVSLYLWMTRRTYRYVTILGTTSKRISYKLGKWKYVAAFVCFLAVFFAFLLPIGTLLVNSMTSVLSFAGGLSFRFNFPAAYIAAFKLPLFWTSLAETVEFSIGAGIGATIFGLLLSYAALRNKTIGARLSEFVSAVPLLIPGIIYTVGLFWTFLLVPGANELFGTIWPLLISLLFINLPQSTRIISSNLVQLSRELEEASQITGSSWLRTISRIVVPLIRVALINSFVFVFANSLRELGGVVILATPSTQSFTTLLLDLYSSQVAQFDTLAAGSLILTGLIAAALAAFALSERYVLEGFGYSG